MKKLLIVGITLVFVLMTFAATVSAATPSVEGNVIADTAAGVDESKNDWSISVLNSLNSIAPFQAMIDKLQAKNSSLNPIAHKELKIKGSGAPSGAVTVTMKVASATPASTGYFLLKKADGSIVQVNATMGNGTVTATFDELGEIVFLSDIQESEVYIYTEGMGSVWKKGSTTDLHFKTNGEYSDFDKILIDGKDVDAKNYTTKAGSTHIYLKPAYLETLALGEHTITSVYKTHNDPVTNFKIVSADSKEGTSKSDKTADSLASVAALFLVGTLAVCVSAKKLFA